jgi:hypothetical protein
MSRSFPDTITSYSRSDAVQDVLTYAALFLGAAVTVTWMAFLGYFTGRCAVQVLSWMLDGT